MDFRLDLCFEPLDFVFFEGKIGMTKGGGGGYRKEGRGVKDTEVNNNMEKDRKGEIRKKWTKKNIFAR